MGWSVGRSGRLVSWTRPTDPTDRPTIPSLSAYQGLDRDKLREVSRDTIQTEMDSIPIRKKIRKIIKEINRIEILLYHLKGDPHPESQHGYQRLMRERQTVQFYWCYLTTLGSD
jgi:hypothetical protein